MWVLRGILTICLFNLWWTCHGEAPAGKMHQAVKSFSVDLLKKLSEEGPVNNVVSPVSVSILLAMVHQGARHNSSSQLETVLHLTQQESREGYSQLSRALKESNSTTAVLEVANRVFLKQGYELKPVFREAVEHDFQSGVEQVTFGTGEGGTAINNWVSEATHGRIPSIVEPRLDGNTALVLANAIFFKSPWKERFNKYTTSNQTFSVRPGKNVTVPMMIHNGEVFQAGIDEERDLKWVELPFEDERYCMIIIVPNERYGLAALLRNLTGETLGQLFETGHRRYVTLRMPRFKISSENKLEAPLKEMGANDIFDKYNADLSGIITSPERLYVSKALQKADIEVDEEGATAAAATVMQMAVYSALFPKDPMEITADRPFLAIIVDKTNRMPLFMATVVDPSST